MVAITAMVGGLAYSIAHSQSNARRHTYGELSRRADVTARLTAGALAGSSGPNTVAKQFRGPKRTLEPALAQWESVGTEDARSLLLDARGRPLASWVPPHSRPPESTPPAALLHAALNGATAVSDLIARPRHVALVWTATPFKAPAGQRVLVALTPATVLASFAQPYLRSAPAVPGARAYLIDSNGLVVGASTALPQGSRVPDPGLASAALRHASGTLGSRYWVAAPVHAGTDWRVVFSVSRATLLAPATSGDALAWGLFAAFVLALLGLVALAFAWIRRSGEVGALQERERAARELAHERLHDSLTSLPNRALFVDLADAALRRAAESGRLVAVLFADVDHFKRINDSLGHTAGDELLALLAQRLRGAVRPNDTVSRFGGDEFLVLCDDLEDVDQARSLAEGVSASLADPFSVGDRLVHVTCGIGISVHGGVPAIDAATLVRDADAAMHRAKRAGEGRLRVFDASFHDEAMRRLDTETALRDALRDGELAVHYQPIVALPDGRVRGVEALARWQRMDGFVPPTEFIALAEECGLIGELGAQVMATAMADVARWHDAHLVHDDFALSINISPRQLADPGFPDALAGLLSRWPLNPSSLWLELTESAVVGGSGGETGPDPEAFEHALGRLAQLGVRLVIDDFGVGLSSLHKVVQSLHVDAIKLDRSFVMHMRRPRERAVVAAVAPMATALGLAAVAEGVERADQVYELVRLGYPLAQGYHFGRPMPAEALCESVLPAVPAPAGATVTVLPLRSTASR